MKLFLGRVWGVPPTLRKLNMHQKKKRNESGHERAK